MNCLEKKNIRESDALFESLNLRESIIRCSGPQELVRTQRGAQRIETLQTDKQVNRQTNKETDHSQ